MPTIRRAVGGALVAMLGLAALSCGGGSDSTPAPPTSTSTPAPAPAANVVSVIVDSGPDPGPSSASVNTLFTTVTICVPGSTTQCQTIDHIQVDTQSYGLRVLAPVLTLTLPVSTAASGESLVECTQFADGYSWGPVATADIQIGGESAAAVPVQVIGAATFPTVPAACASTGSAEDTVATFGANGIVGIGVFEQDCGSGCAANAMSGFYYSCSQTACSPVAVPLASQVTNPVPLFSADNNGTIIDLPAVAATGAETVSGSLIFGIDTESNNASGTQTVLALHPDTGSFTTVFNGQTLDTSIIDSGTNGIYFDDSAIPACTASGYANFYCPSSTLDLSATLTGENGVSTTASFDVANAVTLTNDNPSFAALPSLSGTFSASATTFDWGLPFFYGRRLATALANKTTTVGTGPYMAF